MPLLHPSSHITVAQLCSAISDWTSLPFDRIQYRSLQAALGELVNDLDDAEYEQHRSELSLAFFQLKRWSAGYAYDFAKTMEARYA